MGLFSLYRSASFGEDGDIITILEMENIALFNGKPVKECECSQPGQFMLKIVWCSDGHRGHLQSRHNRMNCNSTRSPKNVDGHKMGDSTVCYTRIKHAISSRRTDLLYVFVLHREQINGSFLSIAFQLWPCERFGNERPCMTFGKNLPHRSIPRRMKHQVHGIFTDSPRQRVCA